MDQRSYDADAWSVYAGLEEEDAASSELRWKPTDPACPGSLHSQIERLLGKDCEIVANFFETIWTDGLQAALEDWEVQRANEGRVRY
jgi:hypothetical protein